jgi:c-di-GMP-binding flagellar brake protein YcgR
VEIELDADTRFHVDLRLQHVTSLNGDGNGVRLGCEFVRVDPAAQRALQRFIDQTQKRGKLLSLG